MKREGKKRGKRKKPNEIKIETEIDKQRDWGGKINRGIEEKRLRQEKRDREIVTKEGQWKRAININVDSRWEK